MNPASSLSLTFTSDVNVLRASGELDRTRPFTELHLADGRILRLNTRAIAGLSPEEFDAEAGVAMDDTKIVIPLIEEQLVVGKRVVETGKVTLQKTVQEYEHSLHEPLALRTYDVERKVLNEPVEAAPSIRQEGATTIYPVVEEQLILTKQLILKEEIHVTRRDGERIDSRVVTLQREHLEVRRGSVLDEQ